MSPLAANCECTVTPGFCFLNAAISSANGVASVPAPNTISVPWAPGAPGLAAPSELPLLRVRNAASRYKTTGSTIGRAYRYLADAGVIDVADRRRSRVAPAGDAAARRLLGGQAALRLAGSDDPGLDIVLRQTGADVITVGARGSFHGLTRIWRGSADAAAIHLRPRSGGH